MFFFRNYEILFHKRRALFRYLWMLFRNYEMLFHMNEMAFFHVVVLFENYENYSYFI